MQDTVYDYYADEERPIRLSESRLRFIRAMQVFWKSAGLVGVLLIAATYLDSAFVYHQYYFFLTEQAALSITGSCALVIAGNSFFWSLSRPGSGIRLAVKVTVLLLASPVAAFFLVLAVYATVARPRP